MHNNRCNVLDRNIKFGGMLKERGASDVERYDNTSIRNDGSFPGCWTCTGCKQKHLPRSSQLSLALQQVETRNHFCVLCINLKPNKFSIVIDTNQ